MSPTPPMADAEAPPDTAPAEGAEEEMAIGYEAALPYELFPDDPLAPERRQNWER
jgi:hypothetical protein